ncbi:MAG: hypothetical protein Q8N88_02355, partial [Nanoarchaeota archaeon]|nr:hypothetical protein [Nanoarchaeota archaeon]
YLLDDSIRIEIEEKSNLVKIGYSILQNTPVRENVPMNLTHFHLQHPLARIYLIIPDNSLTAPIQTSWESQLLDNRGYSDFYKGVSSKDTQFNKAAAYLLTVINPEVELAKDKNYFYQLWETGLSSAGSEIEFIGKKIESGIRYMQKEEFAGVQQRHPGHRVYLIENGEVESARTAATHLMTGMHYDIILNQSPESNSEMFVAIEGLRFVRSSQSESQAKERRADGLEYKIISGGKDPSIYGEWVPLPYSNENVFNKIVITNDTVTLHGSKDGKSITKKINEEEFKKLVVSDSTTLYIKLPRESTFMRADRKMESNPPLHKIEGAWRQKNEGKTWRINTGNKTIQTNSDPNFPTTLIIQDGRLNITYPVIFMEDYGPITITPIDCKTIVKDGKQFVPEGTIVTDRWNELIKPSAIRIENTYYIPAPFLYYPDVGFGSSVNLLDEEDGGLTTLDDAIKESSINYWAITPKDNGLIFSYIKGTTIYEKSPKAVIKKTDPERPQRIGSEPVDLPEDQIRTVPQTNSIYATRR